MARNAHIVWCLKGEFKPPKPSPWIRQWEEGNWRN